MGRGSDERDGDVRVLRLIAGAVRDQNELRVVAERLGETGRDAHADLSMVLRCADMAGAVASDRRTLLRPGEALIVTHDDGEQSWWADGDAIVIRASGTAIMGGDRIEAGRAILATQSPTVRLLSAYAEALWSCLGLGDVPSLAARHLAEVAGSMIEEAIAADRIGGDGQRAARLALMREMVARHHDDPRLDMARAAAAAGLSERSGYLLFEDVGESFSDLLYATRLDRAADRLRAGYAGRLTDLAFEVGFSDLSHFNRRFRRRFGMTPSAMRAGSR